MILRRVLFVALLLSPSPLAIADDAADVRAAATGFMTAVIKGDRPAVDAALARDADDAREMAEAICTLYAARAHLLDLETARFGADAVAAAPKLLDAHDTVDSIAQAAVKVDGGHAALQFGIEKRAHLGLTRTAGGWKVDELSGTAARRADAMAWYPKATAVLDRTAKELDAGRFASMQQAVETANRRLGEPASGPAK